MMYERGRTVVSLTLIWLMGVTAGAAYAQPCDGSWDTAVGNPGMTGSGLSIAVSALAVFDDGSGPALYAGGYFTQAGSTSANHIAKWNGTSWSALGTGMETSDEIPAKVFALTVFDNGSGPALYAGGSFDTAGGVTVNNVAKWDGSSWSALGGGTSATVYALTVFDDGGGPALYAGGKFYIAGSFVVNFIAKWDGSNWDLVGSGVGGGINPRVSALTVFSDTGGSALYAAGDFTSASGVSANRIAKWDGTNWHALDVGLNNNASALAAANGTSAIGPALYVGGNFSTAGGSGASYIAEWDGSAWSSLGSGVNARIFALTVHDFGTGPALYVGGDFTEIVGGIEVNHVAMWDGSSWGALGDGVVVGGGVDDSVRVLAGTNETAGIGRRLYTGGAFTNADGSLANHIAAWACAGMIGDCDGDNDVDLDDYGDFHACFAGPGGGVGAGCDCFNFDNDSDVDLDDWNTLQRAFTG